MKLRKNKEESCILYSGGSDSTLVAALIAKKFNKMHLLTYKHRFMYNVTNSCKNVKLLKKKFGEDKFIHHIIDINRLYEEVYNHNHLKNLIKYRGLVVYNICGACRFSMHIATILYCIENNINHVFTGNNTEYTADPGQIKPVLNLIKSLYIKYNLKINHPIYDDHYKERSDHRLFKMELSKAKNVKDGTEDVYYRTQPKCIGPELPAQYQLRCNKKLLTKHYNKFTKIMYKLYKEEFSFYFNFIEKNKVDKERRRKNGVFNILRI